MSPSALLLRLTLPARQESPEHAVIRGRYSAASAPG
jgi:hypothetical protein